MRVLSIILLLVLAVAGCVSPTSAEVAPSQSETTSQSSGENVTHLGTFTRGLVYFSFQATGPNHEIRADYSNIEFAVTARAGTSFSDGETARSYGFGTLSGGNHNMVSVRHGETTTIEQFEIPPASGGGAHMFSLKDRAWNHTWWVAFGATALDGNASVTVTIRGDDFRLVDGPFEADARYFTGSDWTGGSDVRAGVGSTGMTISHDRQLDFMTNNGTFLVYLLGFHDFRVDSLTLSNTTDETSWTGVDQFGVGQTGTPGSDSRLSTSLAITTGPDDWRLTIHDSVRQGASADHVFLADVSLPPEFQFKL